MKKENLKALSLIEVSFAVVLVGIIAVSMVMVLSRGHMHLYDARMQTVACFLAQEEMEIRSNWANKGFSAPAAQVAGYPEFDREVTVEAFDPCRVDIIAGPFCPYANLDVVTVVVSWDGKDGAPRDVTMRSFISNF